MLMPSRWTLIAVGKITRRPHAAALLRGLQLRIETRSYPATPSAIRQSGLTAASCLSSKPRRSTAGRTVVSAVGCCAECPTRIGHNKLLWRGPRKAGDRCTDPNCYQAIVSAQIAQTYRRSRNWYRSARPTVDRKKADRVAAQQVHRNSEREAEVERRREATRLQGV